MSHGTGYRTALHVATHSGWYRFERKGDSWTETGHALPFWSISCIAVDPKDPRTIYAGTEHSGLFFTHDAGATWTRSDPNVPSLDIFSLWALPGSVLVGTRPAALFHGKPGGPWEELTDVRKGSVGGTFPPNPAQAPRTRYLTGDPSDSSRLYAGIEVGGLLLSNDSGDAWTTANEGMWDRDVHQLHHSKHEPELVVAACGEGIFRSTDRAGHWEEITPAGPRTYGTTVTEATDGSMFMGVSLGRPNTWIRQERADSAILGSERGAAGWHVVAEGFRGGIMDSIPDPDGPGIIVGTSEGELVLLEGSQYRTVGSGLPCISEIAFAA
jgi:hypothetical protein